LASPLELTLSTGTAGEVVILAVDGDKTNQYRYYWMKDHEWKVIDSVELFTTEDLSKSWRH
jgi:hypothetical protein